MPKLKNKKHELFAQNLVKAKFNQTKALQATYPDSSYKAANVSGTRLLQNPAIELRVQEIANQKGLTVESLVEDLNNLRQANKPIIEAGVITAEYPDSAVRLETVKTGFKLHGLLSNDNRSIDIDARTTNNVLVTGLSAERLNATIAELKALTAPINEPHD